MRTRKPRCADCGTPLDCPSCRARQAGAHTSPAKAAAARANGRKGGRPRKTA